ncbi:MAG: hypothetical protein KDB88_02985, partial [Flavobacteriales bacterium]|nr:hypothetical protein [Flavobacteriales bacterium]
MRYWSFLFGFLSYSLAAQSWLPSGLPGDALNLQRVWSNATEDTIYCAGAVKIDTAQWFTNNPVLRYTNGQWDTLGAFNNIIWTFAHFQDTLFVGGDFTTVEGMPVDKMACFANGSWHPCGSFSNRVRTLKVLGGELYAVGAFVVADGDTCFGIARRSSGQWIPVGDLQPASFSTLNDVELFNGNIIISGAIRVLPGNRLAQFDGTTWSSVGQGVVGTLSGPLCLNSFQGSLYIGGQIRTSEGNAGENVMRWDGSAFHPIGDGIRQVLGTSSTATVTSLVEHDGLLYAGGGYFFVDSMPANGLATWDGTQWCVLPGDLMTEANGIWSMAFYQDSLFVATIGDTLGGQFINKAAKSAGILSSDTCGTPVGVYETSHGNWGAVPYPNPCTDYLTIPHTPRVGWFTLTDVWGRELELIEVQDASD